MEDEKKKRGFAALSVEQRKEIARKGGKACHALGKGHLWTKEQAQIAGRKGGQVTKSRKGGNPTVSTAA